MVNCLHESEVMWKSLVTLSLVILAFSVAWGQVAGSAQATLYATKSLPFDEFQKLSESSKENFVLNETLKKFQKIQLSPETQLRNNLIKRIQKNGLQMRDGGNVSGGGDDPVPFTGAPDEAEIIKEYQRNLLGIEKSFKDAANKKIRIAILDSGLSADSVIVSKVSKFIDFTSRCPRKTFCHDSPHGNLVADLISQVAPDHSLIILKTLSEGASGQFQHLLSALQWLLKNHRSLNIRVVNLSLTSPEKISGHWNEVDRARELVKKLDEEGVVIVSAAGNDFQNNISLFPASSPHVLVVGSYSHAFSENPRSFHVSQFSNAGYAENPKIEHSQFLGFQSTSRNFNSWVFKPDVLAPGENILACATSTSCEFVSGTSFAAALVTGGIAQVLENQPSLTKDSLMMKVKSSTCNEPFVMGNWDQSKACALKFDSL